MKLFKKYLSKILIVVLIVGLVFALVKIDELETHIDNMESNHQSKISALYDEVGDIYYNVDNQLKKQASLFSSVNWELVEPDIETNTVKVNFVLVPKTITDDMQISVGVGNETVTLLRDGNTFSGEISVDMFLTETAYPNVSIISGETVRTELLEDTDLSGLYVEFLPVFTAARTYGEASLKSKPSINFDYLIDVYNTKNASVNEYYMVLEQNGKEIDRQNITEAVEEYREHHGDSFSSTYSYDIDISEKDEYFVYAVAVDSYGYIHKSLVFMSLRDEESIEFEKMAEIYAPNGTCLTDDSRIV